MNGNNNVFVANQKRVKEIKYRVEKGVYIIAELYALDERQISS